MHPNEQLLQKLFKAFNERNHLAMNHCYATSAEFSDPVFTDLKGKQIGAMWHMLCAKGKDLQIICKDIKADNKTGTCRWEAIYTFSATGNKVHNKIVSNFVFQNGLIKAQKDTFDLYSWSAMALGVTGTLLGWLPSVKQKIRTKAGSSLQEFIHNNPEHQ